MRTRTSRLRIFRLKLDEKSTIAVIRNSSAFQKRTGSYFENVFIKFKKYFQKKKNDLEPLKNNMRARECL